MNHLAHTNENNPLPLEPSTRVTVEVVYTPDCIQRQGWRIWGAMVKGVLSSRGLIWRLILRDISVRYRQSVLGYVWAILPPIVAVAIFAFLAGSRVLPIGETSIPYVAYALWGLSVWQLFSGCLTACTNSLTNAGSLVTKINFPKEALVIAAIGQPLFDFLVRLFPVAFVFAWYDVTLPWQVIFMPLFLTPVVLLALGAGFVLSIANLALRDIGNAVGMALTFGLLLAPILYPPPTSWPFFLVNVINPLSPLLIATQDLIAFGHLTNPDTFSLSCLFSLLVFLVGWRLFHLTMPRIAERA